jgi:hypothetical protein
MIIRRSLYLPAIIVMFSLFLLSCGGGGGSTSAPPGASDHPPSTPGGPLTWYPSQQYLMLHPDYQWPETQDEHQRDHHNPLGTPYTGLYTTTVQRASTSVFNSPVFTATDYYPLNVNNWMEFTDDATGTVHRWSVTGAKDINGVTTKIVSPGDGNVRYETSDTSGVRYYGYASTSSAGDTMFSSPLLMVPETGQIGTSQTSSAAYAVSYQGAIYNVDVTTKTTIIGTEDITTDQSTLEECIKISTESTKMIRETGDTATDTSYAWYYKGVGLVKQVTSTKSETISASYISGILVTYAAP